MIRATLDSNVLAAGLIQTGDHRGAVSVVVDRWLSNELVLVLSRHIEDELIAALDKAYFRARLTPGEIDAMLDVVNRRSVFVELIGAVAGVAAHRHDDPVLETAIAGNADYLVTGDAGLLALGTYEGVTILSARQFLDVLDMAAGETAAESAPG